MVEQIVLPEQHVEQRVRYVLVDVSWSGSISREYTFNDDGWFPSTPDGAATYPWLMNNAIVWVEERVVYEPEPWEVV